LRLAIRDDGRGVDRTRARDSKTLGFLGMRERARLCGGKVSIRGGAGGGTVVRLEIPLNEDGAGRGGEEKHGGDWSAQAPGGEDGYGR